MGYGKKHSGGRTALAAFMLFMAITAQAAAHDLWFEKGGDGYLFYYGHLGDESEAHDGERIMQADMSKLKSLYSIDVKGDKHDVLSSATLQGKAVKIPQHCAGMSLCYYNGFFSILIGGEEKNLPKNKVDKPVIKSWESKEFVKYIDTLDKYDTVFGDEFEIVPLKDIREVSQGDKLKVKVLYKGQPVKDSIVAYKGNSIGTTDENGEIRIKLRDEGLQSIEAGLSVPIASAEADTLELKTSLQFVLKK